MRWFLVTLLLALPAHADEPAPEMVTIPRAQLLGIIEEYKTQRAANVLLWQRQEEVNERLNRWHSATNCI